MTTPVTTPASSPQRLYVRHLSREAWRSSQARPVASLLVMVLTAAMCLVSLSTVGRSVAAEGQVRAELEDAGARELVVANGGGWNILGPDVVALAGSLSGVERAVGVGVPVDVTNVAIPQGDRGPAWGVSGNLDDVLRVVEGRTPRPGEALVNTQDQALFGFADPVGAVVSSTGKVIPVVGSYVPKAPFDDLNGVVVYEPDQDARQLRVVLADIGDAAIVQDAVLGLLGSSAASQVSVTSPVTIANLHTRIVGTLGRFGAGLLAMVLGMGALLVAAVVAADTAQASVEWGRRRALGASRSQLVTLATVRVGMAAVIGAVIGMATAIAVTVVRHWAVDALFAGSVATLAVIVAIVAAFPSAVRAAWRDPVSVLRTP